MNLTTPPAAFLRSRLLLVHFVLACCCSASLHAQTPAFLPGFTPVRTNLTTTNTNVVISYFVPATNATTLSVATNAAYTNLQVTVGNPGTNTFGVVNYKATAVASTNILNLTISNSVSSNIATTNLTIICQPLAPLQVRLYDMRADTNGPAQILPVGTGANDLLGDCSFFYVTNGVTNTLSNGYSVNFTALPAGNATNQYGTNIPYRTLYVSNVQSGTLWIGLTSTPYTNALTAGNPAGTAAPGVQWSEVPFGVVEYAYTGGGFDTADVTMINDIGVPVMLRLADTAGLYPGSSPVGVTNTNTLEAVIPQLLQFPGVNWFGAAPNTNLVRLLGPSSASSGGTQMAYGGSTNTGNYLTGWPGFSAVPMSPYVSKAAQATTNPTPSNTNPLGQPWEATKIAKQIGDPDYTLDGANSQWFFTANVVYLPNTNVSPSWGPLASNYAAPIPVLTNVTVTNIITATNGTKTTNSHTTNGLAVAFVPDRGSPTNTTFSYYIYAAPASFKGGTNQGYMTFYAGGTTNQYYWTNLANYTNGANSPNFTAYVLDAFLNEISFGFAGGFVQSPVMGYTNGWISNSSGRITGNTNTNPPNVPIGMMTSAQWWQQTNLYAALQPGSPSDYPWYSQWGNAVFEINPTIYSHPISDRMEYVGFTPGMPLGAANANTNVWMEVYIFDEPGITAPTNAPAITLITTNGVAVPGGVFSYVSSTNFNPATGSNNIYLDLTNDGSGNLSALFPTTVITATNTNGGGLYIGSIPSGLTYEPATRTISGTVTTTASGWLSIGLMPYSTNGVSVATIPVYVNPYNPVPTITGFSPATALPGATVNVSGHDFLITGTNTATNVSRVVFAAGAGNPIITTNFQVLSASNLTVVVPTNGWNTNASAFGPAQVGPIRADTSSTNLGVASTNSFTLRPVALTGFSPTNGPSGSNVTLQGFFFGVTNVVFSENSTPVATTNFFPTNGTPTTGYSNLVVTIPAGAATGPVQVNAMYTNTGPTNGAPGATNSVVSTNNFAVLPSPSAPVGPLSPASFNMPLFNLYASGAYSNFSPWTTLSNVVNQQPVTVANQTNMLGYYGAAFSSTNLPRGLYLVNHTNTNSDEVTGFIVGAPVDGPGVTNQVTITASNSAGVTNFMTTVIVNGYIAGYPTNGPALYGSTNFTVTAGVATNLVITYSNGPTYFSVSNLPAGMTNGITLVGTGASNNPAQFALALSGTPTVPGTNTVTILAVNVTGSQPSSAATTNTNTIQIVVGSGSLTYGNWLANYPSLTGTNTNTAADPDGDSFNNATEYAFDGNPTVGSPAMLTAAGSGTNSVFRFAGLQGASTNYTVQTTTNLSSGPWTNAGVTVTNAADQSGLLIPASYERREFTVPAAGSNSFYRVLFAN
jgi:hypothetical protein